VSSVLRSRRLTLAAAALAAALAFAAGLAVAVGAFGGSSDDFDVPDGVLPLGDIRAGSVASLADCSDWVSGSVERKRATVVDVRQQLAGGGVERTTLPDQDAYDVFERACAESFTARFHLYKIYFRAAAFHDFDPQSAVEAP
jgi:hypothetical protein